MWRGSKKVRFKKHKRWVPCANGTKNVKTWWLLHQQGVGTEMALRYTKIVHRATVDTFNRFHNCLNTPHMFLNKLPWNFTFTFYEHVTKRLNTILAVLLSPSFLPSILISRAGQLWAGPPGGGSGLEDEQCCRGLRVANSTHKASICPPPSAFDTSW